MLLQLAYRATRPSLIASSTPSTSALSIIAAAARNGPFSTTPQLGSNRFPGMNYAQRQAALKEMKEKRATFKIKKGKKDITEYPDEHKPQSRKARFFDPESNFGKKSIVYKLKSGQLNDELKQLQKKSGLNLGSDSAFLDSRGERRTDRFDRGGRSDRGGRGGGDDRRSGRRGDRRDDRKDMVDIRDVASMIRDGMDSAPPNSWDRDTRGNRDRGSWDSRDRPSRDYGSRHSTVFGSRNRKPRESGGKFAAKRSGDRPSRDGRERGPRSFDARPSRDSSDRPSRSFGDRWSRDLKDGPSRSFGDRPPRGTDRPFRSFDDKPSAKEDHITPAMYGDRPLSDFKDSKGRPIKEAKEPLAIPYTTAASQFLYGKSSVEAALSWSRRKLYKLYIYSGPNRENMKDNKDIAAIARRKNIEVILLRDDDGLRLMDKMSASRPHNGFVLEASPLPQPPLASLGPVAEDASAYAAKPGFPVNLAHQSAEDAAINGTADFIYTTRRSATHRPLVVILDRILDPGNLGAILRTVSFLGASAVAITKYGGATITPVALKSSAGAAEAMNIFGIQSLPEFLNESRANGWQVYAAVAREPKTEKQRRHVDMYDIEEADPLRKHPCVLVLGSEGEGLDRLTVKKADYELNIPNMSMSGMGAVDSLNVGVAAGLLSASFMKGMTRELNKGFEEELTKGKEVLW